MSASDSDHHAWVFQNGHSHQPSPPFGAFSCGSSCGSALLVDLPLHRAPGGRGSPGLVALRAPDAQWRLQRATREGAAVLEAVEGRGGGCVWM